MDEQMRGFDFEDASGFSRRDVARLTIAGLLTAGFGAAALRHTAAREAEPGDDRGSGGNGADDPAGDDRGQRRGRGRR